MPANFLEMTFINIWESWRTGAPVVNQYIK